MKQFACIWMSLALAVGLTACGGPDNASAPSEPLVFSQAAEVGTAAILADLTEDQLLIFESIAEVGLAEAKQGLITLEKLDASHSDLLEIYILEGQLPPNARPLYEEWKEGIGYYDPFAGVEDSPSRPAPEAPANPGGGSAGESSSAAPQPTAPAQPLPDGAYDDGYMTHEEMNQLAKEQAGKIEINQSGGVIDHGPGVEAAAEELPDWVFEQ